MPIRIEMHTEATKESKISKMTKRIWNERGDGRVRRR